LWYFKLVPGEDMTDLLLNKAVHQSYITALNIVKNIDDAQDISQSVAFKILVKDINFEEEHLLKWITTVTKHDSFKYIKKQKKNINFEQVEHKITENILNVESVLNDDLNMIIEKFMSRLNYYEQNLLRKYLKECRNIKILTNRSKFKYNSIQRKIYRLKKNMLAEYYQYAGMIGTKQIVNAKLHENILNFINKFKLCLENNSLENMRIYFGEKIDNKKIPPINISRIHSYDIVLLEKGKFKLFVCYFEPDKSLNSYFLIFEVYNKNRIRIVKLPKLMKSITGYDVKKIPIEVREKLRADQRGVIPHNGKQINELLSDCEITYRREN